VSCRLDRRGSDVVVHLAGPPISEMHRRAVAVRVLDAVRSMGRTYSRVDVDYLTPIDDRDGWHPDAGRASAAERLAHGDGAIALTPSSALHRNCFGTFGPS
jgi:hypothetical protein